MTAVRGFCNYRDHEWTGLDSTTERCGKCPATRPVNTTAEVIHPPQGYWIGYLGRGSVDGMIGPFATEGDARNALAECAIVVVQAATLDTGSEWHREPTAKPEVTSYDITLHRTEVLGHQYPQGSMLATSEDHPGKQFLIIPEKDEP